MRTKSSQEVEDFLSQRCWILCGQTVSLQRQEIFDEFRKQGNYLNSDLKLSQAERDDADDGGKSEAVKGDARGGLWAFRFHSIGDKDEVEQ